MRTRHQHSRTRSRSRATTVGVLGAVIGLFLGLIAVAAPSGAAPVVVTFDVVVSTETQQTVGGNDPVVLVEADNGDPANHEDELFVTLTLQPPGTTFKQDTVVRLTPGGSGTGAFSPSSVIFPKDETTWEFSGITYGTVESGITLVATSGRGPKAVTGTSAVFDVGYDVVFQDTTTNPVTLETDCVASRTTPLCAQVLLPKGVPTRSALAIGACQEYYSTGQDAACRSAEGSIVSFMADVELTYKPEDPATIIVHCDKSYCKGGGVTQYTLMARPDWDGLTFAAAPACATKGQVQAGEPYCVDYVQSKRDNAGDLILYWLVAFDPRGAI